METLPLENWELARPNITAWFVDLGSALNTRDISAARDRVLDLSKRIDTLTRSPVVEVDSLTPEPDVDDAEEEEDPEEKEFKFVENDPMVCC